MTNAYALAKIVIKSKKKSADYCYNLINTYLAVGALTDEQYTELVDLINELYGE